MAGLECCKCGYYWRDEDDDWECCHWDMNCSFPAPCEEEVFEPEDEWDDDDPDLEVGFDPYEGGYTWDC